MTGSSSKDIVLVDDNEVDTYFLRRWLKRSNIQNPVRSFSSGRLFLTHMSSVKSGAAPMPALVLLDINMPGADGFQVLESLRAMDGFDDEPDIFLYTNSDNPVDRSRAEQLGVGFLEKFSSRTAALDFFHGWCTRDA
jgi:two-component system response regulator